MDFFWGRDCSLREEAEGLEVEGAEAQGFEAMWELKFPPSLRSTKRLGG